MSEKIKELTLEEQAEYLMNGCFEVLPEGKTALISKLKKAQEEKRPLRVKLGIDPTAKDLHLGHTVCLQVLKKFQKLGHLPVLIIGGFTAQLGDPTGRNEARPPLTNEQVAENAQSFLEQFAKVLDLSKVEVVNNADWLQNLSLKEILHLASTTTVNQIIGKEAFGERLEAGHPLYVHEIFYPILQGYDSVKLKADIEIGGQDQRFNVLAGRSLQKIFQQTPQAILLMPLLIGLDGKRKMSKTFDNFIALKDSPEEMFGKTMSLPDELLLDWFSLVLAYSPKEISKIKLAIEDGENPKNYKVKLAKALIETYYDENLANKAEQDFIQKFSKKQIP
ncbi:MAG TPA: tyrosine--tRNA ligase, partial [Vampirovibrionales bacterium]